MGIENLLAQGYQPTKIEPYGNALMRAQQFKMQQAQLQNALMQGEDMHAQRALALQQAQQQAEDRAGLKTWRDGLSVPHGPPQMVPGAPARNAAQAESAAGLPGYGASSAQPSMMPGQVDPRMAALTQLAKLGGIAPKEYVEAAYPQRKIGHAPAGSGIFDERTGQLIGSIPDKAKEDAFVGLMRQAGIDPMSQQGQALLAQRLAKESTHAPSATMNNYGSPVAGTDPTTGNPAFAVTDKQGNVKVLAAITPPGKELPASLKEKLAQNNVTLQKIDKALGLVETNGGSLGAQNVLGDAIMQRADPSGVEVRAMIADIGGQKIHDRSGAAVTVGEAARLKPYIPAATDTKDTAKTKLQLFRREYSAMQQEIMSGAGVHQAAGGKSAAPQVMRFDAQGNPVK